MTILHIDSSILGEQSASRSLTAAIVQHLKKSNRDTGVIYYDLAAHPLTHLSAAEFLAWQGVEPHEESSKQDVAHNIQILDDFLAADVVVIGAPMYNFTLPSQLKVWLDRLAVAGKTFRYTEKGAEGLVGSKRIIVASSRGGLYSEGMPGAALDHQETYLRGIFSFFGIPDITVIRAEGLALSPEIRKSALDEALSEIRKLAA